MSNPGRVITFRANQQDHQVAVVYRQRDLGGWYVCRADNERKLGWLCRQVSRDPRSYWEARVSESAYRGEGPDDTGDVLDRVPRSLTSTRGDGTVDDIGSRSRRDDAAELLLAHLWTRRAPALGFGRHPEVTPWRSRVRDAEPQAPAAVVAEADETTDAPAEDAPAPACSVRPRTMAAGRPCARCPWVIDTPPGEFTAERYRELRATTGEPGREVMPGQPMFACHKTPADREVACAGWLRAVGVEHLGVRLAVRAGAIPAHMLGPAPADWPPLFTDYATMAAAQGRPDERDETMSTPTIGQLLADHDELGRGLSAAHLLTDTDDPGEYRDQAVAQLARAMGDYVRIMKTLNGPGCDELLHLLHTEGGMDADELVHLTGMDVHSVQTRLDRYTGVLITELAERLNYTDAGDATGITLRALHPATERDAAERERDALDMATDELRRLLTEYAPGERPERSLRLVLSADPRLLPGLLMVRPQMLHDLRRQLDQAAVAARQRELDQATAQMAARNA